MDTRVESSRPDAPSLDSSNRAAEQNPLSRSCALEIRMAARTCRKHYADDAGGSYTQHDRCIKLRCCLLLIVTPSLIRGKSRGKS